MKKTVIALVILFSSFFSDSCNSSENEKGTLIVTYQTDHQGSGLDRIRFWVKNEKDKQKLYPKKDSFVDDLEQSGRMVVIDDLKPGTYFIEFLVPNMDDYFEDVEIREVNIVSGETLKINQIIKPKNDVITNKESFKKEILVERTVEKKFGKIIVSYDGGNPELKLRLHSFEGESFYIPQSDEDSEIDFDNGKMIIAGNILEGKYFLEFVQNGKILAKVEVNIEAEQTQSIHQSLDVVDSKPVILEGGSTIEEENSIEEDYDEDSIEIKTKVTINTNTPKASFELINVNDFEKRAGSGENYTFDELSPGTYEITFSGQDSFIIPPEKKVLKISEGDTSNVDVQYQMLGKLVVDSNVELAFFTINEMTGSISAIQTKINNGSGERYLPGGKYRLTFHMSKDGSKPPKPMDVEITPLETIKLFAEYKE